MENHDQDRGGSPLRCCWCGAEATGMNADEPSCEACARRVLHSEIAGAEAALEVLAATLDAVLGNAHADDVLRLVRLKIDRRRPLETDDALTAVCAGGDEPPALGTLSDLNQRWDRNYRQRLAEGA